MKPLHPWNVTPKEAVEIQQDLRTRLDLRPISSNVRRIAGGDVAYAKDGNTLFTTIAVLTFPEMETVEESSLCGNVTFPYIPGLLAFREGPGLVEAFRKLRLKPDAMIVDGHGIAHPQSFGLASHVGLWTDIPTIGCAKTPFFGEFSLPGPLKGSFELIRNQGVPIGAVLRTRANVKPVYVSPGHRIDINDSVRLTLESCKGFRIPEPLRRADHLSRRLRSQKAG